MDLMILLLLKLLFGQPLASQDALIGGREGEELCGMGWGGGEGWG